MPGATSSVLAPIAPSSVSLLFMFNSGTLAHLKQLCTKIGIAKSSPLHLFFSVLAVQNILSQHSLTASHWITIFLAQHMSENTEG